KHVRAQTLVDRTFCASRCQSGPVTVLSHFQSSLLIKKASPALIGLVGEQNNGPISIQSASSQTYSRSSQGYCQIQGIKV
ncbi:MAG: hypothetical protein KKB37_10285, partial [Alphaproteobacteria bacterium]|nr:hypothetical protein [Alphaproteobacteria bacterium]